MAITAKVEILCQQLKENGMYAMPPALPTTSDPKPGNNMHFQPIDLAQKSSVQTMDQSLLNSSLNLIDDLPRSQSSSSNGQIPCGQTTPQGSTHESSYPVPPMPYINQTAVNQHMAAKPTPIPPRMSTGPMNLQPPLQIPSSQMPSNIQPQRLPFVDAPPASTKNHSADNTNSPSTHETRSKTSSRQGIKQSSSVSSSTSTSMGKSGPICWNCGEVGHRRRGCQNPPYCSKCKQKGHLPMRCPLKGKRKRHPKCHKRYNRHQWTRGFPVSETNASTVEMTTHRARALRGCNLKPLQTIQVTKRISVVPLQVRLTIMLLFPLALSKNGQPTAASMTPSSPVNSSGVQGCPSCAQEPHITPQVSPSTSQQNFYNMLPVHPSNHFPPPPYFPILFLPPPIAPSNASNAHSAPVSDISVALTLMTNAVMQGNSNTTAITNALERTMMQFANALQQTIQMGVDAQAQENKNARMDKQFEKVKVFDGSKPFECHPWLDEVHALCIQTGRPFHKMLYYVQAKLSATSSQTCPRKQRMIKLRMTS